MSLLSKAEIQFLEGHKLMSKSYERKLKRIIRKKVEGLKKDILLVSKLIPIEQIFDFENLVIVKRSNIDQEPTTKISNPSTSGIDATKISSTAKVQYNLKIIKYLIVITIIYQKNIQNLYRPGRI